MKPSSWILSGANRAGTQSQCLGLAQALGLDPILKKISPRLPWRYLPPQLWFAPLRSQDSTGDPLSPPWPQIIIASGRATVASALHIRRKTGCYTIFVQDPLVNPKHFDLVIPPTHDGVTGSNVIPMLGMLHHLTQENLKEAAQQFSSQISDLPPPYITVLVGGKLCALSILKNNNS